MKSEEQLPEKQGLTPQEIARPLSSKTFVLEDSSEIVVMRKPIIDELIAMQNDKTIETATEEILAMVSLCSTFDGKAINWQDLKKRSVMDYNELSMAYAELTRPKKMR